MVVNGATGIIYFTWGAFKADPAKLAAAQQVFAELTALQPAIFGTSFANQTTAPTGIAFIARQADAQRYIIAVNPNASVISGAFTAPGLTGGAAVTVMFEGRQLTASGSSFSDTFPAYSRHVYRYP
jgi:hypothetical protein